jgi:tetratricopeptide (TPR) repeat protein
MFAMKRILAAAAGCFMLIAADAQLKTPAPSPTQNIKQDFGLGTVELSYSRPGVKGRKIFGDLVPYGQVWRTGANNATTLTFGDEVIVGDKKIPAGKYGLLTIPDKSNWVVILSKKTDITSPADYKQDDDVVRVTVPVKSLKDPVETFTIQFANVKPSTCELQLLWAKSMVALPIATEIDSKIMANINAAMKTEKPPYFQAAMYYLDNGKDLNQAKEWFSKAAEGNPKAFWIMHQWANCLARLGEKEEARAKARQSRELAAEAKNDDYVKLNDKLLASLK